MVQGAARLPEFERPPVSEVAISVEFSGIDSWRAGHAGLYWRRIKSEYPASETQPPLPSQIERFDERSPQGPVISMGIVDPNSARFWFLSGDGTKLVQVQRDRFIINWRKVTGTEVYPRYESEMRPRLEREWRQFEDFIGEEQLGSLAVQQCDITYINDIPQGEGWETLSDSLTLFSPWWGNTSGGFLPPPESVNVTGSFLMPSQRGRLHFATQNVIRYRDQRQVVQLRLTARGKPEMVDLQGVLRWLDLGHEWIVRAFADLTSPTAHALWDRRRP